MPDDLYQGCTMGDLLLTALHRGGDRVAFIHGERQISYRAFGQQLSRLVQALASRGMKHGDSIATLSANRPEAFLVTAAAYLMGLRVTWLNPTASEDDHAYVLQDAGVETMFVDPSAFADRARALQARASGLQRVFGLGPCDFGEDILRASDAFDPAPLRSLAQPDDVCVLIYTGGTTGRPKGVVHTHRVQVTMVLMELAEWDWPAEVRFLAMTPITHASGLIILAVLLRSGSFMMSQGFDAERFLQLVQRHRISSTFLVPTMVYLLLDHPRIGSADLTSLEVVMYGAAPMSPPRLVEAMQRFGPVFMQLYGQCEAPMTMTVLRRADHDPAHHPQRLASCGTPVAGNQLRLLDEHGDEVADGEVGEICLRGPLVMPGYWNRPEETAQALRHGWLYSGDLARRDADGFLYIVDRSKDMIVSGGFNVFPREVEDVLSSHPAVAASAVVGVPDAKWGEAVRALVVLRAGASVSADELAALVKRQKGAVHVPKAIDFVDTLPVTALGKLDKKAIRARYWPAQGRAVN